MMTAAIIISMLLLLALLRAGVIVQYNGSGLALWLKAGFLKIPLNIGTDKKLKRENWFKPGDMKPGSFSDFIDMLKAIKNTLGRVRRRLLVKKLIIHYVSSGKDPVKTALGFGAANAVFGFITPVLERNFRIKHRELRTTADFDSREPEIYVLLNISIAVWEAIYVIAALMPVFTKSAAGTNRSKPAAETKHTDTNGKDLQKDGKRADKQPA